MPLTLKSGYLSRGIGLFLWQPVLLILISITSAVAIFEYFPRLPLLWLLPLVLPGFFLGHANRLQSDEQELTAAPVARGLCDKTTLIRFLLDAMSVAGRYNRSLSLVLLEIQACEHPSRSKHQYLEAVADQLEMVLRLPDRMGYFGRNTLVLLLPETSAVAAAQVATRCQKLYIQSDGQHKTTTISKTVVVSYRFGDDLQSLLDRLQSSLTGSTVTAV
ncbi:MAG TPA: diguanylate cyclase [Gammaproteobacteria bacterium]|nr:diguanylate cyclase [Gammaproteobacteria bacterium]